MGTEKNMIQENARLFASRGQFDKAIAEWKKLTTGAPTDSIIYNTIGDLHVKRNATAEAVEAYLQTAAAYRAGGEALKAIAVYRKILNVDPACYQVYRHLGDLDVERGLVSNALSHYLTLSKLYLKAGSIREALELYRTIAKLDPSNLEARRRLAEFSPRDSAYCESAVQHAPLGEQAPAATHGSVSPPASQPPERPKEPKVTSRLSVLEAADKQIKEGQYAEAEAGLTELLDRMPGDPEVCRLLALLHLKRGELSVARAEFRFLAEAAVRAKEYELAESILSEYLKADPTCAALLELLGRVYQEKGDRASAVLQYGKALAVLEEHPAQDMPTLPAELYANIKLLDPTSPFVNQFAPVFEPAPPHQETPSVHESGDFTTVAAREAFIPKQEKRRPS